MKKNDQFINSAIKKHNSYCIKSRWLIILFIICISPFTSISYGQTIIKATDYGVRSNGFEDANVGIHKAIAACKPQSNSILRLPGGRIDIWPERATKRTLYISNGTEDDTLSKIKSIAFLFENCKGINLEGNKTLVVLHGKMVSFALLNSTDININNISFDYERPTVSEMTIRSVSEQIVEADIHSDSKYTIENGLI